LVRNPERKRGYRHKLGQILAILKELENKYIPTRTRKQIGRSKKNFPVDKNTREKNKKKKHFV
jgi:hypothetical protein